jgi:hypothetical protein
MTEAPAPLRRAFAFAALAGALVTCGCQLDVVRVKGTKPIAPTQFEALEVKKTTKGEVLDRLGPPDKLEFKLPDDRDHWYFHYYYADSVDVGLRFQFPPPPFPSFLGYRHNFLRLEEGAEDKNSLTLVFDENDVLEEKSLRLTEAHAVEGGDPPRWKVFATPWLEHSVELLGDADFRSYHKLFHDGYRAGVDLGVQPAPVVTLFARGSFEEYDGTSFVSEGTRLDFGDLNLYAFEVGLRLASPLRLLWTFYDFEEVKKVLFGEDMSDVRGFRIFIQGTTGVTINSRVRVRINGAGEDFLDEGTGFSGGGSAGLEYAWAWGSLHGGVSYQSTDGFDGGDSGLDDDAGAFSRILVGGGLTVRF